jgi:hypothetical protein
MECELFDIIHGVNSYKFSEESFNEWIIERSELVSNMPIFLVIDLAIPAFSHWVFESAIFLPYFTKLKLAHPSLKIYFKIKRNYKELFCKYLSINSDDITYDIIYPCSIIFSKPFTSLNIKTQNIRHRELIRDLFLLFQTKIKENDLIYSEIILPRQVKDNYEGSNCKEPLDKVINYINTLRKNFYILNTDDITDLNDQIDTLKKSKNIIIVDGSALLVNSLFVKDSYLHVPTNLQTEVQGRTYPQLKYILECSRSLNNNCIYYYKSEEEFILQYN